MQNKNYGLNWQKELQEQSEKDWILGAESAKCIAEIPIKEREESLPKGEVQKGREDTKSCASFGPINILETKFNWLILKQKISNVNISWLSDNGYMNNMGQIEFSDAFIAIKSGTTEQGNSMKAPLEAIRKNGLIPKKILPLEEWMTWQDFNNPARITKEMENLGQEFSQRFPINYERVLESQISEMLIRDILDLAGFAWPEPINGEYPKVDYPPNHVFVGLALPMTFIFDSYTDPIDGDFIKKLAENYDFMDYGYRLIISEVKKNEKVGLWQKIIKYIMEMFK